jgi:hypothetical protein
VHNVVHLERERNAENFKYCVILVVELKTVMSKSLYDWMAAYNGTHFSGFT